MKKLVSVLLAMLLLCGVALAGATEEDEFYQHGLDLIDKMAEKASNSNYISLLGAGSSEAGTIMATYSQVKDAEPTTAYKLVLTDSRLKTLILSDAGNLNFSDTLMRECLNTLMIGIMNIGNSQYAGNSAVNASSLLSTPAAFAGEMAERTIYIYVFDCGLNAIVSCIPSGEGAVLMTSYADFSGKIVDVIKGMGLNPEKLDIKKKDETPKTEEGTGKKKGGIIKKSN